MTGKQLYEKYTAEYGPYAKLLRTIHMSLMERLYPLLERAEREGKKLDIKPYTGPLLRDDVSEDDIIFV